MSDKSKVHWLSFRESKHPQTGQKCIIPVLADSGEDITGVQELTLHEAVGDKPDVVTMTIKVIVKIPGKGD